MFRLGYNTNGFNCHSLESALEVISSLGYQGAAITLDNYILNPWSSDLNSELDLVERRLNQYSLSCVIETGARFLLNPRHKHEPTPISNDAVNVAKQSYAYLRNLASLETPGGPADKNRSKASL